MDQLHELKNFVDVKYCNEISAAIESTPVRLQCLQPNFYKNRTRDIKSFKRSERAILNKLVNDIIIKMQEVFDSPDLIVNFVDIVSCYDGHRQGIHADAFDLSTGKPYKSKNLRERAFTGILYLNDDFTGGETIFPKLHRKVTPETGTLAIFSSNIFHQHGVTEVRLNTNIPRYTMVIWAQHASPSCCFGGKKDHVN